MHACILVCHGHTVHAHFFVDCALRARVRACGLTRPDVSPSGACMQFHVDRTTLATKSSTRVTGIGGSTMDGRSVHSAFLFPGKSVNAERFVDIDHTGKVVHDHRPEIAHLTDPATKQPHRLRWPAIMHHDVAPCFKAGVKNRDLRRVLHPDCLAGAGCKTRLESRSLFVVVLLRFQAANGKGGMSDKMAMWLLFNAFIPTFEDTPSLNEEFTVLEEPAWRHDKDNPFRRSNSADDVLHKGNVEKCGPGTTRLRAPVIVCDGHSSHLAVELLEAMANMQQFVILDGKKHLPLRTSPAQCPAFCPLHASRVHAHFGLSGTAATATATVATTGDAAAGCLLLQWR